MIRELVIAEYKTGVYVGERLTSEGPKHKVRVLAVLRHPEQGDLHHPLNGEVGFFHQRKALAHLEVANMPAPGIRPYPKPEPPEYGPSLSMALEEEQRRLHSLIRWAERGLEELEALRKEYGR